MDDNDKLAALLGSAYLLKKSDDILDDLEREISEIKKDVKNILRDNQRSQRENERSLEENKRLLKEIKQKIKYTDLICLYLTIYKNTEEILWGQNIHLMAMGYRGSRPSCTRKSYDSHCTY